MSHQLIAHVRKNEDGTWAPPHLLVEHLENTAKGAETIEISMLGRNIEVEIMLENVVKPPE